jgi:hypothetical protein
MNGTRVPAARRRLLLLVLAVAVWLAGFAVLRERATWLPFVVAGVALATLAIAADADNRRLLRPSAAQLLVGVLAGGLMIALTHAAFAAAAEVLPALRDATERLLALARSAPVSASERAALIAVIAACEEVIFRGAHLQALPADARRLLHPLARVDLARIVGYSAVYAASMITLGSALLVACAFACAIAWAALRVATRGLAAPIAAHVTWDLGVLIVWPLVERAG